MIALEVALRFPDRVRGLVLGGTSAGGAFAPRSLTGLADIVLQRVPLVPAHVRRRRLTHALFSAGFRAEHPELVDEYLEAVGAHRARALGAWWHLLAAASFDRSALLPYIGAPTLVLHGDADALTPVANARLLARRIPDNKLPAGYALGYQQGASGHPASAPKIPALPLEALITSAADAYLSGLRLPSAPR